jgi:hypothetical protein
MAIQSSVLATFREKAKCRAPAKFGFAAAAILASTLGFASLGKNIALPLGDRDNPARVKEVEYMRRLDALVICWQHHHVARAIVSAGEERVARGFRILEMPEQDTGIRGFEIIA